MMSFLSLFFKSLIIIFYFAPIAIIAQYGPGGVDIYTSRSSLMLWLDADNAIKGDSLANDVNKAVKLNSFVDRSANKSRMHLSDTTANIIGFYNDSLNRQTSFQIVNAPGSLKSQGIAVDSFFKFPDLSMYLVLQTPLNIGKRKDNVPLFMFHQQVPKIPEDTLFLHNFNLTLTNTNFVFNATDIEEKKSYSVAVPYTPGRSYIVRLSSAAANGAMQIELNNGTSKNTITSLGVLNSRALLTIGYNPQNPLPYPGTIASVLVYSGLLNLAERVAVENFLSAKYNIALSANDIYIFDNPENGDYDLDVAGIGRAYDGSVTINGQGEGMLDINNPRAMGTNEFLFWGRNKIPMNILDSVDTPKGTAYRLATRWACNELGEVGAVDIFLDSSKLLVPRSYKIFLTVDKNHNGQFADDDFVVFDRNLSTNANTLRNIQLNNGDFFTLGAVSDKAQWTSTLFTPNGDGIEDTYYIQRRGMVRILDQNGSLIRNIRAPGYWDGRNEAGQLAPQGGYIVEINETDRINISVRY